MGKQDSNEEESREEGKRTLRILGNYLLAFFKGGEEARCNGQGRLKKTRRYGNNGNKNTEGMKERYEKGGGESVLRPKGNASLISLKNLGQKWSGDLKEGKGGLIR